jgi:hypothetical protein
MVTKVYGDTGVDKIVDGTITSSDFAVGANVISSGTSVASTSGTSIDFTSIPSWVKRITVMFNGVSTSGTANPLIQIGSGSITSSGYTSRSAYISGASVNDTTFTAGFGIYGATASNTYTGHIIVTNISSNIWVCSSVIGGSASWFSTGVVSLSGVLDQVRITTSNGTDTFDAGSINILYE